MEEIRKDPLAFLMGLAEQYGGITYHRTERDQIYTISDPDLVGETMAAGEAHFTKHGAPDDLMLTPILGEGLLTSHGDSWSRQRELTQPMFFRRRIEAFIPMMAWQARKLGDSWLDKSSQAEPIRVDHDLTSLTLAIVARAVLGSDISGVGRGFGKAVDAVNAFLSHGDPRDTPDTDTVIGDAAAYPKAVRTLGAIVKMLIDARKLDLQTSGVDPSSGAGAASPAGPASVSVEHTHNNDLLSVLLAANDPSTGLPLSEREIQDQVMTMIMAGHETTAKALTWTLYLLDRNPEVYKQVVAELAEVIGDREITVNDLPNLQWCRAAIFESMRLYPPIWVISRRAVEEETIGGYAIPKGSLVCVSPWIMHHHPALWEAVEQFDPSRFLGDRPDTRHPFAFMPFGAGPRRCIGRGFATMEAVVVLATLLQQVDLSLLQDHPVKVQALVTLRPEFGMMMTVRPAGLTAISR